MVRAGSITPQKSDEDKFREALGLPPASEAVATSWAGDGGVRRPITLVKESDQPGKVADSDGSAAPRKEG